MCITLGPARLTQTRLIAFVNEKKGTHVLGYQNTVENLSDQGNGMLFAVPGEMKEEYFYDTTEYSKFMEEIVEQTKPRSRGFSYGSAIGSAKGSVTQFELGAYTVLFSHSMESLMERVSLLPEEKRPSFNPSLVNFFESHYHGWGFVICCFSGRNALNAQPILFEYIPDYPEHLYLPGMDAHNGKAPDLKAYVHTDHELIIGYMQEGESNIHFSKAVPEILRGRNYKTFSRDGNELNGDWFVPVETVTPFYRSVPKILRETYHPDSNPQREIKPGLRYVNEIGEQYEVILRKNTYSNGRTRLELIDVIDGYPLSVCTVNLPSEKLENGEIIIKNHSENAGILNFLCSNGIVSKPVRFVRSGYVDFPVVNLLN
jgi:hypothetical protein